MKSKYTKKQRVLAILGIILLVGLYLAALIASFFNSPTAQGFLCSVYSVHSFIPLLSIFSFLQRKNLRHQMTTINHLEINLIKGVFRTSFFDFPQSLHHQYQYNNAHMHSLHVFHYTYTLFYNVLRNWHAHDHVQTKVAYKSPLSP